MRMIDADALKEKAFGKRGGLIHTSDIDAMPTIERKKGKWIETDKHDIYYQPGYKCSVCGVLTTCHGGYCPNCGADMRGEQP